MWEVENTRAGMALTAEWNGALALCRGAVISVVTLLMVKCRGLRALVSA